MNIGIRFCLATLLVSGLGACTTTHETAKSSQHASGTIVQDTTYVRQVERIARKRGVDVKWVNPPIRRSVASND